MTVRSFAHARTLSRQFFPTWSRRARARWVLAWLRTKQPRIPISAAWSHDTRDYWLQRTCVPRSLSRGEPDARSG